MDERIVVREMVASDCGVISRAFAEQGWDKPERKYQRYFQESVEDKRVVLIAECEGTFAGYLTILWDSTYPPFKDKKIPEIADFNVLIKYRRRGIGTTLMNHCEKRISERGRIAGISVGLTTDYGAAQILYFKRGYAPDGRGIFQMGRHLKFGEPARVDDDLTLFLTKTLR